MTGSKENAVFENLDWSNYRRFKPQTIEQLHGAWAEQQKKEAIKCWYALLMDAVNSLTSERYIGYPARLYAIPGTLDENAKWTDDYRTELVIDLFDHLYKQNKDTATVTGNQFDYIEGAAQKITHVDKLIKKHLERVLHARLSKTAFGRASNQLFDALKEAPFIDTTVGITQFRQKLIGIKGWETVTPHDEEKSIGLARHEFTLMKRNMVTLGETSKDEPQKAVNWYKTSEIVNAASRIIIGVTKSPVTPDFLTEALEHAFRGLDTYRESRDKNDISEKEFDENDPNQHQSQSDVRSEDPSGLYSYVPLEIKEEVRALLTIMQDELTQRHPSRDIEILYGFSTGERIKDIAESQGVDVKTVSRRRDEIKESVEMWQMEYGDQIVGTCMRLIFGDRPTSEEQS
jgi:DNA-binding NarL/FixJ family response regulator